MGSSCRGGQRGRGSRGWRGAGLAISALVPLTGCSMASPPAAVTPPAVTVATPTLPGAATAPAATAVSAIPTAAAAIAVATPPAPSPVIATAALAATNARTTAGSIAGYGASGRREIALTFDAGADRGYAAEILDLLQAEGIRASFGILGQWAEANPDLVRRMVDEGHMLFNHSWSHASMTGATTQTAPLTQAERWEELQRTDEIVRNLTGYDMQPYFRPAYGDYDASVLADIAAVGYPVALLWSCDSRDSLGATAEEILANCIDTAQPGRIVLLHVGSQSAAYEALPRMIATLREQGFAFVTADEILQP